MSKGDDLVGPLEISQLWLRCLQALDSLTVAVASVALPTAAYHGVKAVVAAGTAVPLAASQALKSGVHIKAAAANSGVVYVGNSAVDAATGYPLAAGAEVFVEIDNLAKVYVDAATNDDSVAYFAA